ncbi:4-hydroxy-tetrahydrodipicolinate reductase, partial [Listeria monocytogenes]|nr:4-hydroxy-tetrahydrodipicolinate reductase [Listeria monocytogenes]
MKQILLSGANGRMGKVLQSLIAKHPQLEVAAGLDRTEQLDGPFPIYDRPEKITQPIDLVIDFSHYSNVPALLNYCVEQQLPIVVATTGLTEDTQMMLPLAAKVIPVFYSANMSLGINVLIKALQSITPALEADFDIEIIEKHHNQKLDAPSGTALLLADSINDSCETKK